MPSMVSRRTRWARGNNSYRKKSMHKPYIAMGLAITFQALSLNANSVLLIHFCGAVTIIFYLLFFKTATKNNGHGENIRN